MKSVYCAVWTGSLNKAVCDSSLRVSAIPAPEDYDDDNDGHAVVVVVDVVDVAVVVDDDDDDDDNKLFTAARSKF